MRACEQRIRSKNTPAGLPAAMKCAGWALTVLMVVLGNMAHAQSIGDDDVKIWEFSPYEVEIWYSFDPSVQLSDVAREAFLEQMQASLQRTYRATWRSSATALSPGWEGIVSQRFDDFELKDLSQNELVLVVALKHPDTRTVRTFDAAIDGLGEFSVEARTLDQLKANAERFGVKEESPVAKLISNCKVDDGGLASIAEKLESAEIAGALISRAELSQVQDSVRAVVTMLPWQTDSILRKRDKVLFLMVGQTGSSFHFRVRELDCPMQYLGPTFEDTAIVWPHAARVASDVITKAFAPIARVEDAEALTASLLLRAGGLVVNEGNPSLIEVGDIMQPIVRRDDRNGVPTLLQPLSFTYAAITESNRVKMEANVYTYKGGPGLQGRKNRRTRRVLLRVRPRVNETDIRIVVRGTDTPQAGCFVYKKDLLTGKFDLLGRTDWRGQFTVSVPEGNGKFLPEEIRKARYLAEQEAKRKAAEAEAALANAQAEGAQPPSEPGTEKDNAVAQDESKEYDPEQDEDAIPLNFPLLQIYLKNGDTVVARLPLVPGLQELEVAELPDDSRRLRAEAFVKGFQGEILDLIGLRNLYAAQIKLHLDENQVDEAVEKLDEMRSLRNYNQMADELERIQREMLDEKDGKIAVLAKNRIDRMFSTTRNMLQKYLQDNLLRDSEQAVDRAVGSSKTSANSADANNR